jgi:hypothetical protein
MQQPVMKSLRRGDVWETFKWPSHLQLTGTSKKNKVAVEVLTLPFKVDQPDYFKPCEDDTNGK